MFCGWVISIKFIFLIKCIIRVETRHFLLDNIFINLRIYFGVFHNSPNAKWIVSWLVLESTYCLFSRFGRSGKWEFFWIICKFLFFYYHNILFTGHNIYIGFGLPIIYATFYVLMYRKMKLVGNVQQSAEQRKSKVNVSLNLRENEKIRLEF